MRRLQIQEWIHAGAAVPDGSAPDLEVEVGARGVARHADPPDQLAAPDMLAAPDGHGRHVVVGRIEPGTVRDPDLVAPTVVLPAGEGDDACGSGLDGGSAIGGDVDRVVAVVEVLADVATSDGPAELAAAVAGRRGDGVRCTGGAPGAAGTSGRGVSGPRGRDAIPHRPRDRERLAD